LLKSAIISSSRSLITEVVQGESTIISSACSCLCQMPQSIIIAGKCNMMKGISGSSNVMFGANNTMCTYGAVFGTYQSSILGGCRNTLNCSRNSSIIGGSGSQLTCSNQSVIVGGIGLTLSNEDSVTFVPKLKIATASNNDSATKVLVWDTDNYVKWRSDSTLGGSGTIPNGITGSTPYYTGSAWTYSNTNIYNNGTNVGIGTQSAPGLTPSSTLHVFGSLSLDLKTKTTAYTVGLGDFTILANPAAGGMTVSLPSAAIALHRVYVIKRMSSTGLVQIRPNGSDTIEAFAGNITLDTQYDYQMLQSDGVDMWIKLGGAVGLSL
jgi:hypothetical protein